MEQRRCALAALLPASQRRDCGPRVRTQRSALLRWRLRSERVERVSAQSISAACFRRQAKGQGWLLRLGHGFAALARQNSCV